jgi:hypothetical protein
MTIRRVLSVLLVFGALAAACSADSDEVLAPMTTTLPPTTVPTTTLPPTTVPTTALPPTTAPVEPAADTTTTVVVTTSVDFDNVPPAAPTNLSCDAGGGSQEVAIEWDTPLGTSDIQTVRIYLDEGSGFVRIETIDVSSGFVQMGPTRWSAVAFPVPPDTEVEMAVTYGDASGNESGWNPIGVYFEFSGAPCRFRA